MGRGGLVEQEEPLVQEKEGEVGKEPSPAMLIYVTIMSKIDQDIISR